MVVFLGIPLDLAVISISSGLATSLLVDLEDTLPANLVAAPADIDIVCVISLV